MNRRTGLFSLFLFFFFISAILQAEIVTLSTGDILSVASLTFDGQFADMTLGTNSKRLPKNELRDISFTGQDRDTDVLATDATDLPGFYAKAQALQKKYTDTTSITVFEKEECIHRSDGTNVTRIRIVSYIAKEEARGAAEVWLSFDPNREKVRILHARCYSPDGKVTSLAPDQIKISKGSSGGEYFSQNQNISFTIPNATVGYLVDYSYESEEFNPFDKQLFQGFSVFQNFDPIGESILQVTVPKDQEFYYVTRQCPAENASPTIKEENNQKTYQWRFTDMPPIVGEPSMPSLRDIAPGVAYCLQKDWTYIFNRLKPMFEKRFQLTDLVKQKVDELTAGAATLDEKIARLYRFCQKEIRYISIKGNLASNQVGHPAEDTLKNRYGDCTDKGMLLATMLKHLGVEAYPVGILTNPSGKALRELPLFDSNHCITEVHLNGKRFYLDSTATDYRYPYFRPDDHETIAENAVLGTNLPVPLPPPEDNALKITRSITLSPDGTTKVSFDSEVNGGSEASFRGSGRSMKPEEYEKSVRASVSGICSNYILEVATHTDPLDFSAPYKTRTAYTLNRYASRSGRYMMFEIPMFRLAFNEISLASRKYDIVYLTTSMRIDDITLTLPPGFRVKYLPAPLTIKTPFIEFEGSYKQEKDGIKVWRKMAVLKRVVPVKDYPAHRETLERIAKFSEERIFLEETTAGEGSR